MTMKILSMTEVQERPTVSHELIREFKEGYEIKFYKTYELTPETDINPANLMHICLEMRVSVDEYYWLENHSRENINKFNDRLGEVLGQYIRRYLL